MPKGNGDYGLKIITRFFMFDMVYQEEPLSIIGLENFLNDGYPQYLFISNRNRLGFSWFSSVGYNRSMIDHNWLRTLLSQQHL